MGFIEELYYGNIRPNEKEIIEGTHYTRAIRRFCNREQRLNELLSGEPLKLFNDLVNASDEISAINGVENFKLGFRLGVQLVCDSLFFDGEAVFRDIAE